MQKEKIISGIQQIGIGVSNVKEAWKWYLENFGMDIRIFEELAYANLMLPYTGGEPRKRHAVLAMNLQGGGGFEIWQYTGRTPSPPKATVQIGDLGIVSAKIKTRDVRLAFENFKNKKLNSYDIGVDPDGKEYFFIKDPFGNVFQVIEGKSWFKKERHKTTGAICGVIIGVSDIDKARSVYSDILGYDKVVYDKTDVFEDLRCLPGGHRKFRRILLQHSIPVRGFFSRILGPSEIELIRLIDDIPSRVFKDRFWGDLGFIHLCYDIHGMDTLREECKSKGFPFTVDSGNTLKTDTFDMGEAAGHFAYIEDPDGTLIEFVETHKLPIIKKLGLYLDLRKRDPLSPLPDFMLKALRFGRVKGSELV